MQDVFKNIEEYNPNRKCKILIVFDDMIANMMSNKKNNYTVAELFIRERKLSISTLFITQFYFAVPKDVRLINCTHFLITKILKKQEFQQITFNQSSDIGYENFMNLFW